MSATHVRHRRRCRARPCPRLGHNAWVETLEEWAKRHGRNLRAVRAQFVPLPDFPKPKGQRPRTGRGAAWNEYDPDELDTWLAAWDAAHRPAPVTVPDGTDLDEHRTLGAIARLAGQDGRTITQYRDRYDSSAEYHDQGARRYYRTRDVLALLNERLGRGRTLTPEADRRRGLSGGKNDDDNDD